MHALVYTGTNKIDFRKEKDPIAKPGEIIVKVKASGICGSDMHAFHGNDERRVPPLISVSYTHLTLPTKRIV